MNVSESVENFAAVLRMYANYSARSIKQVCTKIGPRPAGSEQEKQTQEFVAQELEGCCDSVKTEPFRLAPVAFMIWIPLCVLMSTLSVALYFLGFALLSLILTTAAVIMVVFEFLLYKQFLDAFAPKKTSHNVVGIRKPQGETKRRIVFSGHADSSMEWRFNYYGGPKLLVPIVAVSFIALLAGIVVYSIAVATGHAFAKPDTALLRILGYVLLVFVPVLLSALLFNDWKHYVQGANDNLTGVFGSIAVLKFMQDHNIRFANTEIWVLSTGAEEAGLRGAKAFCKQHAQECAQVETVFIGLETLRDFEHMAIYRRDMTGTVKNSPKACALVQQAALQAGYELPLQSVYFGSSDAAAVSQADIHATTLASMDPAPARYYHTRLDTCENLDIKTIEKGVHIALETAFLFDKQGLS